MKIISWNVNGLRAVYKKGFLQWLEKIKADIVCLQETKIQEEQLSFDTFDGAKLRTLVRSKKRRSVSTLSIPRALARGVERVDLVKLKNYSSFFNSASKKGYSGVAVFSKKKPLVVKRKLGIDRFDDEGRFLELRYPEFILINLYIPHGGRQKENLAYKLKVYQFLFKYLQKMNKQKMILIGDFNIAHQEIDLARPRENQNNIMFTLKEREQIDKIMNLGFTDSFRKFYKEGGHYTWWPYLANARERNLGWRIDYAFVSKKLTPSLKKSFILSQVKGSDHCPIGIEI